MQHLLYGLRGQAYIKKYRELFSSLREEIKLEFLQIVKQKQKFTRQDLGYLCIKFKIPVKVMDEWLPDISDRLYPTGTWERLQSRGCKAKDIGVEWE
ncbi:hypothetical protein PCC7424_5627 (plasmid) [Gloeothece citriformis PCC 7424]|uniref:Uncharacterized protein n=1 Tax=Gloeothece citriformis (strain PCC 7424) TaxID=65393 RepID=B7KLN1_GLOC7|nr:hypothetical protein [Gloeothece citriformis]ACK73703.1 hypothetical protein PCC7424_5627 [Gloeothece citriformis PCC 7424]